MAISTYRLGTPRRRSEGLRLGAVRYLPRGVARRDYARLGHFDVWLPALAPSRELFGWMRKNRILEKRPQDFLARYAREMRSDPAARQTIALLAALGRRTHIAVGCYCEDESRCHRSVLLRLLKDAQRTDPQRAPA